VERSIGCGAGVSAQRVLDADLLFRIPASRIRAVKRSARDGGVDPLEWSGRRDKPVAPERQPCSSIEQRAERIRALAALMADDFVRPTAVVNRVVGLHARDDTELCEPGNVGWSDVLGVLDTESPVTRTVLAFNSFIDVELR